MFIPTSTFIKEMRVWQKKGPEMVVQQSYMRNIHFESEFIKGAYFIFLEVGEGRRETLSPVPLKETFRRRFVPFLSKERSERIIIYLLLIILLYIIIFLLISM